MPKTTGQKNRETGLIERLAKKIPSIGVSGNRAEVRLGIGDDSAVLRPAANSEWVLSCDFTLEGLHFRETIHPPLSIGYRCLVRAASDIAAMGACPRYFLLALALPTEKTLPAAAGTQWLDSFASGMARAARELGMVLVGGDITRTPSVTISTTVLGELSAGSAIPRSGARPGDFIYVTGILGAAQLGLEILLGGLAAKRSFKKFLTPHLYPRIPIAFAQALARRRVPSAMIDISDGLSTDLARLCAASRVGARIDAARIPCVTIPSTIANYRCHPDRSEGSAFRLFGKKSKAPDDATIIHSNALQLALHGGEDYGLLFTVPPKSARLLHAIASRTKTRLTHIGEIIRARKILIVDSTGRESSLASRGWDPFHSERK